MNAKSIAATGTAVAALLLTAVWLFRSEQHRRAGEEAERAPRSTEPAAPDLATATAPARNPESARASQHLSFVVRVVDDAGAEVPNAQLFAFGAGETTQSETAAGTRVEGSAPLRLTAMADGHRMATLRVETQPEGEILLRLPRELRIPVSILGESGAPIEGAGTLWVRPEGGGAWTWRSIDRGIVDLPAGRASIAFASFEWATDPLAVDVRDGTSIELRARRRPTGSVSVKLAVPLPICEVGVPRSPFSEVPAAATIPEDRVGPESFGKIPAGDVTVYARNADGSATIQKRIRVEAGKTVEVVLEPDER